MKSVERQNLLVCVLLVIMVLAAFEGVRKNDFVNYDDGLYVTNNLHVQQGLYPGSIAWAFTSREASNWHPLTWLSHIIDCVYFGPEPAGHHLVNLGFHTANVLLLFLILRAMTGALWPSFFVAAAFGLHPLAVESVAWVAQRKNVLSAFFCFLTLAAYLRYSKKPAIWRYLMVAGLFAAGLLSKPMLVTLPFVLMLLDFWPLNRFNPEFSLWSSFCEKLPLIAMSAASCAITYIAQAQGGSVAEIVKLPLICRVENSLLSYLGYIGKVFRPVTLSVLYPFDFSELAAWKAGICLLLLALVSSAAILLRRRFGWLFTGWFWFLGTLVPVIGLVQVGAQSMADRYMYLPGIGLYIITTWSFYVISEKARLPGFIPVAAGVFVLSILLLITRAQVGRWKDSLSLCRHALATTKNNYIMHYNYGVALWELGQLDEAIEQYSRALEIKPSHAKSRNNLGCALRDKGLPDEAMAEFEKAIKIRPDYPDAQNNYAVSLAKQGHFDRAIDHFNAALQVTPCYGDALKNICKAANDGEKADYVLELLLSLQQKEPSCAQLYFRTATLYASQGRIEQAIGQLEKALIIADAQRKIELVEQVTKLLDEYRRQPAN